MKKRKLITSKVMALIVSAFLLNTACTNNNPENANDNKILVESKAKPAKMDINTAAAMGNLEAIKQHIELETDVNTKEANMGSTPLITAAFFGHTEIAKELINAGADLNIQNVEGSTALHTAAFFCRPKIVELLVAADANKTIKNKYNSTALESVTAPYEVMKPIYKKLQSDLKPMGLILDLEYVEAARDTIALMLKE